MSLYEDIQKVGSTQQFPNARFRSEFIRSNMQNPGAFYKQFGADLTNPMGGTQSFNQPLEQLQTLPGTTLGKLYADSGAGLGPRGSGGTYDAGMGIGTQTGTGGLLGTSPALGGLIGTGLGMAGMPFSSIAGQALSGTPESQANAFKGTAINMGTSLLGPYGGLAGLGVNAAMSGKMPSTEQLAMTAAYMNPVTAPLASLYGLGRNALSLNNERLAANYRENEMYGTGNRNTWGAPTTFSSMFGNPSNEMKDEQGTGLMANPSYGLGFNPVGAYGNVTATDMGLGSGLTQGMRGDIQASFAASALNDLYSKYSMGTPETYGVGGNTYGPGTITSDMYGVNPDVMGPPQQPTYGGGGYSGIGSNNDSDGSAGSTNPSGGGISGYGGGTY